MSELVFLGHTTKKKKEYSIARGEVKRGRFDIEYKSAFLSFNIVEATEYAEIAGATIIGYIKENMKLAKE